MSAMCVANGLSEEEALNRAEGVQFMEMVLFNLPHMRCFQFFTGLTELHIAQQSLTSIEGLSHAVNLRKLWVIECQLERIAGLDACVEMRELYLYSNRIKAIENLRCLVRLEKLWLADNQIGTLNGVESLVGLVELNLARNRILRLGNALAPLVRLHTLNVSANPLGSFKEVGNLVPLASLRNVCFSDPHWGECPLAGLCNYQTYVLFSLSQVTSLDALGLASETKQLAEATFSKKKMYYNMRCKTVRRNAGNALRRAADGRARKARTMQRTLGALVRQMRDLEREMDEAQQGQSSGGDVLDETVLEQLRAKRDALAAHVEKVRGEGNAMAAHFEQCRHQVYGLTEVYVRRLLMELSTGGNIRFEDGSPADLWYSSCVDLVQSRFFAADYSPTGHVMGAGLAAVQGTGKDRVQVTGLRVTRVTRIHCRFLRNRFEERLEAVVDTSDAAYKRSLEYLFYGEQPDMGMGGGMADELQGVIEEGFRPAAEYAAQAEAEGGGDAAVALCNSLSLADAPRLRERVEALERVQRQGGGGAERSAERAIAEDTLRRGKLLVTKVFLGKSTEDKDDKEPISQERFPDCSSVYRVRSADRKQRQWLVFDHALVLPEYLVEFEYDLAQRMTLPVVGEVDEGATERALGALDAETRSVARPMAPYLALMDDAPSGGGGGGAAPVAAHTVQAADRSSYTSGEDLQIDPSAFALLRMPPNVAQRSKVLVMTDDVLLRAGGGATLPQITTLNLHGNALRKIEGLASCPSLKNLVLSFNEINSMAGLCDLSRLERVDLSYNQIQRIEGLRGLPALTALELTANMISRLEDINVLRKYAPELRELCLQGNTVGEHKSYHGLVLRRLPKLELFDQRRISAADHARASDSGAALSRALVREGAVMRRREVSEMVSTAPNCEEDTGWLASVEELVLEHRRIRRMQALEGLVCLRRLSLCDNDITVIEGLGDCTRLEELCLEDNRITQIGGLGACLNLKRLDLGSNKIASVANLEKLTALTQLALEDNEITSLEGIPCCKSLMELYLGNNRLDQLRQIQALKLLPKLIICDLSDNPLCEEEDYRHYVIYHLRKLKVLDGLGIEAAETQVAKSKYAGKLTFDLLEDKTGTQFLDHLRELDIAGMRLRDLGTVFASDSLRALKELNLDNNSLTDVSALRVLPHLAVLRLNRNKLDNAPLFAARQLEEDEPPPVCASLTVLQLGGNQISQISALGLGQLQKLRVLFLQDNDIQRVEGLEALAGLRELVLDRNRIKYIDPNALSNQVSLRELRLEENGLRSLAHLGPLPRLHSLHLGCNRVSDVVELDKLAELDSLTELSLSNNPVARKQVYRAMVVHRCEVLRYLDGREITIEERDHVAALFLARTETGPGVRIDAAGGHAHGMGTHGGPMSKVALKLTSMSFETLVGPGSSGIRLDATALDPRDHSRLGAPGDPRAIAALGQTALNATAVQMQQEQAQLLAAAATHGYGGHHGGKSYRENSASEARQYARRASRDGGYLRDKGTSGRERAALRDRDAGAYRRSANSLLERRGSHYPPR